MKTACKTSLRNVYISTRLVFISIRLVFTKTRRPHVVSFEAGKSFRIGLHNRSLLPSQLAFIENENIFTLFHNTNCSYFLERTERENFLEVQILKSKRT